VEAERALETEGEVDMVMLPVTAEVTVICPFIPNVAWASQIKKYVPAVAKTCEKVLGPPAPIFPL